MSWAATTTPTDPGCKDGRFIALEMAASKIYKGDLVRITAAGYATAAADLATGDMFAGVALQTVDNTGGAAGAKSIVVDSEGSFAVLKGTPAQEDVGTFALHATTNQHTVTSAAAESASSVTVGAILGIAEDDMAATGVSATKVRVRLLALRQEKTS